MYAAYINYVRCVYKLYALFRRESLLLRCLKYGGGCLKRMLF